MTDLLSQGLSWLEDQRHQHLTRTVTYQRGGSEVEVQATIGRTVFEQDDHAGGLTRIESRDFLIRAADLVLAAETTLPHPGDRIIETDAIAAYTYEVMAPGTEPPWRYSDVNRLTLRIHTKHVGTEEL
ncbi:MAG: hypothetical protein KJZ69_19060 [Phycisphaerales bacterium]|nr:hypothetical protein [Phycisphaerales bacterium]